MFPQNKIMETFTIIGGGIAGLSAAIALKRIGIEAKVIEASNQFKPVGSGLSLAANAMQALQHLQIADDVIKKGRELKAFTIYNEQGKIINRTNTDPENSKWGISNFTIHRADLHEVLLSHLNMKNIITGKRSVTMEETANGHRIFFEDESFIETKYLIIADGIHSPLRKKLLPGAKLRYAGYTCWRGIADNTKLQLEETSETWSINGRFGIVPLKNNQVYWFACKASTPANEVFKKYSVHDLSANFKNYHDPVPAILKATKQEDLIWNDIYDLEPIDRYAFGNAVLIGDAAHATTPNMGQGACMAIEDAVVLANCLKQNSLVTEAFQSFERKRLKRTQNIVGQSWRLGKMAQTENHLFGMMRNQLFRMLPESVYQKQLDKLYTVQFD